MSDRIFASFGEFMLAYAHTEMTIKNVISHSCGVSVDVGRALFGDMRLKPLIDKLRKVHEVRAQPIHERIELALVQLVAIHTMRDRIVHHGFMFDFDSPDAYTSNEFIAVEQRKWKYPISDDDLQRMCIDLRRIQIYFMYWGHPLGELEVWRDAVSHFATEPHTPWLFKSPQPIRD